MDPSRPARLLADAPRATLAHLPTPLEPAPRLSVLPDGTACGVGVWLKRDDCTGLALGGNKVRKLEFLLGEAIATGCSTVVTFGAVQSNHARQTAFACAKLGLRCELVLTSMVERTDPAYVSNGNQLLNRVAGVEQHRTTPDGVATTLAGIERRAADRGEQVYVIPTGGSSVTGALGYVAAGMELAGQMAGLGHNPGATADPVAPVHTGGVGHVVVPVSTAGTLAGLIVGLEVALGDRAPVVHGVDVYHGVDAAETATANLLAGLADRLDRPVVPAHRWRVVGGFRGEGYGIPTPQMHTAVEWFARSEGVLLDPVYSGKAAAGLAGLMAGGPGGDDGFDEGDRVVFWHTGGGPGLFAYEPEWPTTGTPG